MSFGTVRIKKCPDCDVGYKEHSSFISPTGDFACIILVCPKCDKRDSISFGGQE
jgi:hypothetical protein